MANDKMENSPLTGDEVLAGVIDKVCRHLCIKDLCRVAGVCKSWNAAVQQELERRFVQKMSLDNSKSCLQSLCQFEVKPNTILLFAFCYDAIPTKKKIVQQPTEPLLLLKEYVGVPYTAQVGSSKLYTEESFNTDHDKYDRNLCLNHSNPHKIPCLIIPQNYKCNVKFTRLRKPCVNHTKGIKIFGHKSNLDHLIPIEEDTKTFLMIFTFGATRIFLENTFGYINKCLRGRSYALWGSESYYPLVVNDSKQRKHRPSVDEPMGFVGISISSANMNLFSRIVSCKYNSISGLYQDLLEFKKTVKLGHHSIAFINGPSYDETFPQDGFYRKDYEQEYLYNFKKVFPNVPFISTFHNSKYKSFGHDMTGLKRYLMHTNSINIVIITFN